MRRKSYGEPSMFRVQNLLREGRRQRVLPDISVPDICVLDPDGDVVRHLQAAGRASRHIGWACYHSELWVTHLGDHVIGIVPCVVGAPYAVLVAEELHASGCSLIVSITSAGRILPIAEPPYFILIERAWRDEGTSLHYLPPTEWSHLRPELMALLDGAFEGLTEPVSLRVPTQMERHLAILGAARCGWACTRESPKTSLVRASGSLARSNTAPTETLPQRRVYGADRFFLLPLCDEEDHHVSRPTSNRIWRVGVRPASLPP